MCHERYPSLVQYHSYNLVVYVYLMLYNLLCSTMPLSAKLTAAVVVNVLKH